MEFALLETRRLTDNNQVNIPGNVRSLVGFEHEAYGMSVQWNVDRSGKVAVLSKQAEDSGGLVDHSLRDRDYVSVTESSINNGGSTITLIEKVRNKVEWSVSKGDLVCYLAHKEMCRGEVKSVFVLSGETALDIVRKGVVEDEDYRDVLSSIPE
jgi:hypothetical protein